MLRCHYVNFRYAVNIVQVCEILVYEAFHDTMSWSYRTLA